MIRDTSSALRPEHAPAIDISIHVRRDRQTLEVENTEIQLDARLRLGPDAIVPSPQIRWGLDGSLLGDEIVLVFGRSLDWTGPVARRIRGLHLIEDLFPHPFCLTRKRSMVLSGPLNVRFPHGVDTLGWNFGVVLVRGDDTPWVGDAVLRLECRG